MIYDEIEGQTTKAILYRIDGKKVWIPMSQIQKEDLGNHIVQLPMWLIHEDGLEGYIID